MSTTHAPTPAHLPVSPVAADATLAPSAISAAPATAATLAPASEARRDRMVGLALMLGSGASSQLGASFGALAFPTIGPVGVVAIRQWVAAIVLLAVGRPRLRSLTASQWRPILALAAVFACMNLSLYLAIDRIGLGLAVTLEFLGPLTVALVTSRRRLDLLCALAAGAAVAVLLRPQASTDHLGIGLALVAAVCWACYILVNRTVGRRVPGLQGSAAAALMSGVVYVPIGVFALTSRPPTSTALVYALAAGLLASAVPFLADLLALRRVPSHVFGVVMSVNPVYAALAGLVVLGQRLDVVSWLAIGVIVAANAVAVAGGHRLPARARAARVAR